MRATAIALAIAIMATACGVSSDVSRTFGARCDADDECSDLCVGPSDDHPDGICTRICGQDADCEAGAVCSEEGNLSLCMFSCEEDEDCEFLGVSWACHSREDVDGRDVRVCRGDP